MMGAYHRITTIDAWRESAMSDLWDWMFVQNEWCEVSVRASGVPLDCYRRKAETSALDHRFEPIPNDAHNW